MTPSPVSPMTHRNTKAGPELNALIAEMLGYKAWRERRGEYALAVMQRPDGPEPWKSSRDGEREKARYEAISCAEAARIGFYGVGFPPFSTDIAAAWLVVEKFGERFHARILTPFVPGEPYFVGFTPHGVTGWNGRSDFNGDGGTMPLAICRAALATLSSPLDDNGVSAT